MSNNIKNLRNAINGLGKRADSVSLDVVRYMLDTVLHQQAHGDGSLISLMVERAPDAYRSKIARVYRKVGYKISENKDRKNARENAYNVKVGKDGLCAESMAVLEAAVQQKVGILSKNFGEFFFPKTEEEQVELTDQQKRAKVLQETMAYMQKKMQAAGIRLTAQEVKAAAEVVIKAAA